MRIQSIHVYQKDLPINDGPYTMSTMELHSIDTTIIKMVSDNGQIGWGEVAPLGPLYQPEHAAGVRAAIDQLAPALTGVDPLNTRVFQQLMANRLNGSLYAKAALELAQMDLAAKHYNVRVCDLLGGALNEKLPAYYAISINSPDETVRQAREKVNEGFHRLQLKAGGRDLAIDIEVIKKVWEAVGTRAKLVVDANRGLTAADTKQLSLACHSIPMVLEQPCHSMEEVISIRSQVAHPIHLDENLQSLNDVLRAIASNACDGFGLKVSRMGGLQAMASIRDICAARSIPHTCEDSWGGDIAAAASLQIAATVESRLLAGVWTAGSYIDEPYDRQADLAVDKGFFTLPSGPGLGIEPDESRIGTLLCSYD